MGTHNITTLTSAAAQTVFDDIQTNDHDASITVIFANGNHSWTSQVAFAVPATATEVVIQGSGSTTITDNYASTSSFFLLAVQASGTFTIKDINFQGAGDPTTTKQPGIYITGQNKSFRMTNCTFTWTGVNQSSMPRFLGHINGVIDHCAWAMNGAGNGPQIHFNQHSGVGDYGDKSWAVASNLGSSDFIFVEDCTFTSDDIHGAANDCVQGGRWVWRFNAIRNAGLQSHGTGSANRDRSGRCFEAYLNQWDSDFDPGAYQENFIYMSGGTGVVWKNDGTNGLKHFFNGHIDRRSNQTYGQGNTPDDFGFAGDFLDGTVTVTSLRNVQKTSGNPWIGGTGQQSYACSGGGLIKIGSTIYTISSVTDATHLVLTSDATNGAGQSSRIISYFDGDPDGTSGYPALDQVGRGVGDLLVNDFPSVTNNATGKTANESGVYPRQALEPIYEWLNLYTSHDGGSRYAVHDSQQTENVDYYLNNSSYLTTPTTGVGSGTRSQMDALTGVTDGTAFWVTDEGSWNAGTNSYYTGQGRLYKRVSGSWVLYYEPYPYPHPLVSGTPSTPTITLKKKNTFKRSPRKGR